MTEDHDPGTCPITQATLYILGPTTAQTTTCPDCVNHYSRIMAETKRKLKEAESKLPKKKSPQELTRKFLTHRRQHWR